MERGRARRSSTSGALNQSARNKTHVLGQLFRTVLSEILCRRFAVVFGEERDQSISVSLSMRLLTQDKKKKVFIFPSLLVFWYLNSHLLTLS